MLDRLAAVRARQRSFVADAAHELRSPLASMLTQLDVADHLGEGTPATADLRAEVVRMGGLVESLLVLARLDREPSAEPPDPTVLAPLVADVVRRAPAGERRGRDPGRRGAGTGRPRSPGAREPARQRRPARPRRQWSSPPPWQATPCTLLVDDDGAGIPPEDRDRVFDRFTRLDEARARDAGGSGLGLAIVRELVERDGGQVALTATQGGFRVCVTWPVSGPS